MSNLDNFLKGITFEICGKIGDTLRIDDKETKEVVRFVRIIGGGKTHNLEVGSDDELEGYKKAAGIWVRATGPLGRRRGSTAGTFKIAKFTAPNTPGWKEPTEDELYAGCTFSGWGRVIAKRSGEWNGTKYSKLQVMTFGETFEFNDLPEEMYEKIPETGAIFVKGHAEPKLTSTANGKIADMVLVLDEFHLPETKPTARQADAKTA